MHRSVNPLYLLLLIVFIAGMVGWLYATSETIEVVVRDKQVEEGKSRRGLPVDVHVLDTSAGRLPISSLPVIGYWDAAEAYRTIRRGGRYQARIASYPWSGARMIIQIDPLNGSRRGSP